MSITCWIWGEKWLKYFNRTVTFFQTPMIQLTQPDQCFLHPCENRPIAIISDVGKIFLASAWKSISKRIMLLMQVFKRLHNWLTRCFWAHNSLLAILQDDSSVQNPLMITFLELKNTFGSISHQLVIVWMLEAVKVPSKLLYVKSFYLKLFLTVTTIHWMTLPTPFLWGVFQGATMSLSCFQPFITVGGWY